MNEQARQAALASGISPLDFLLAAMRDDKREFNVRLDAAKAAAPYLHARLASVEVGGPEGGPVPITRVECVIVDPTERRRAGH